jgi:hypothetical protein
MAVYSSIALVPGWALAQSSGDPQVPISSTRNVAHLPDVSPNQHRGGLSESTRNRISYKAAGTVSPRQQLARSKPGHCGWTASRICHKAESHVSAIAGRHPERSNSVHNVATNTRALHPVQDQSSGATPYRVTNLYSLSPSAKPVIATASDLGASTGQIGLAFGQSSLTAAERMGKVAAAAGGPLPPSVNRETSVGASGLDANEITVPGPYAMLLVGMSLVAFIAIRRIGQT